MSRHSKFKAVTNERNQRCGIPTRFPDGKNDPHYISFQRTRMPKKSSVAPLVMLSRPYVSRNCGEFQWHTRRTFSHASQLDLTDRRGCIFRHLNRSSFFFQRKRRIVKLYFVISANSLATFFYRRREYKFD